MTINIISMSRRRNDGLSAQNGTESCGRMPRIVPRQACPRSSKAAENQYYIYVAAASRRAICQNQSEILRANALNCPPSQKLLKINIISMSRRRNDGLYAKTEAESCGRMPQTVHRFTCPRSSKTTENQYIISGVTLGCPSCWH